MLGLMPVLLFAAAVCAAFYYWLSRRGQAGKRESASERRGVSLLTESIAYFGAVLVLAGGGVAVGQDWSNITAWQRVGIFAAAAVFFLAAGLAVLRIADPAIQRMIGVVWFLSAACAGAAAGLAVGGALGNPGDVAVLAAGLAVAAYSAILWLVRRRELQLVALFAGITLAMCAMFITIAGAAGPRLAIALGLWALGVGWVIVGWQYPQPLWSTVPLGTAIALLGPPSPSGSTAGCSPSGSGPRPSPWFASASHRRIALLGAGTLALFGYVTAAVVRYFHASLGLPATLAVCGVLLLTLALVMARIRRATQRRLAERAADAGPRLAEIRKELADQEPAARSRPWAPGIGRAPAGGSRRAIPRTRACRAPGRPSISRTSRPSSGRPTSLSPSFPGRHRLSP